MYEQYDQKITLEPEEQKDWNKLSDFKCPLCSLDLIPEKFYCTCSCGFKIHTDRLAQIQTEQQMQRLKPEHRQALQEGKKVKFKGAKVFKGEREKLDLGF